MSTSESILCEASCTNNEAEASDSNATEQRLKHYFETAMNRTVNMFVGNLKYSLFKTAYPDIHKTDSTNLREIHKQLKSQLLEIVQNDAEGGSETTNVYSSLNSLDNLIEEHKEKKDEEAWRPSGNPTVDTRDHLHQLKLNHKKCLKFILETLTAENEKGAKKVDEMHQKILQKKSSIDQITSEIKNSYKIINDDSLASLEKQLCSSFENSSPKQQPIL